MGGCSGSGSNHKATMPKFPAPNKATQTRAMASRTTRQSYKPGGSANFGKPSVKMNFGMGKKY